MYYHFYQTDNPSITVRISDPSGDPNVALKQWTDMDRRGDMGGMMWERSSQVHDDPTPGQRNYYYPVSEKMERNEGRPHKHGKTI